MAARNVDLSLHECAAKGDCELARTLIATCGADVNAQDSRGYQPLHCACEEGHVDFVKFLLEECDACAKPAKDGVHPLHLACKAGHVELCRLLLNLPGADANISTKDGWQPLHYACDSGQLDVIRLLLHAGADTGAVTLRPEQHQPVHLACCKGFSDIIPMLVHHGADLTVKDEFGWQPIHLAALHGHYHAVDALLLNRDQIDINAATDAGLQPLHLACQAGQEDVCNLLLSNFANVNASSTDGWTPLHLASEGGYYNICMQLLEHGASVCSEGKLGMQPIHSACKGGSTDVVDLLLNKGVSFDVAGEDGWQPIHFACKNGHVDVCKLLLSAGSDVNAKTKDGKRPIELACENEQSDIVYFLLAQQSELDSEPAVVRLDMIQKAIQDMESEVDQLNTSIEKMAQEHRAERWKLLEKPVEVESDTSTKASDDTASDRMPEVLVELDRAFALCQAGLDCLEKLGDVGLLGRHPSSALDHAWTRLGSLNSSIEAAMEEEDGSSRTRVAIPDDHRHLWIERDECVETIVSLMENNDNHATHPSKGDAMELLKDVSTHNVSSEIRLPLLQAQDFVETFLQPAKRHSQVLESNLQRGISFGTFIYEFVSLLNQTDMDEDRCRQVFEQLEQEIARRQSTMRQAKNRPNLDDYLAVDHLQAALVGLSKKRRQVKKQFKAWTRACDDAEDDDLSEDERESNTRKVNETKEQFQRERIAFETQLSALQLACRSQQPELGRFVPELRMGHGAFTVRCYADYGTSDQPVLKPSRRHAVVCDAHFTSEKCFLKRFPVADEDDVQAIADRAELWCKMASHPDANAVPVIAMIWDEEQEPDYVYLHLPFVSADSLASLHRDASLSMDERKEILRTILRTIAVAHDVGLAVRSLDLGDILVKDGQVAMLSCFGPGSIEQPDSEGQEEQDVMLFGRTMSIFLSDQEDDVKQTAEDLMLQLVSPDNEQRPTAAQALQHTFFA